jgi:hypothetical protein
MAKTADEAGGRPLTGIESALWYGLAGATYVGLSLHHKLLLNWVVGPLWLVAVVWLGPALLDVVRGRPEPGWRPR